MTNKYDFARVGIFNYHDETVQIANFVKMKQNKPINELGTHFSTWDYNGFTYVRYQQERVMKNPYGRGILSLTYIGDRVQFTKHSLERLWQRSGHGIANAYKPNLGIHNLDVYLNNIENISDKVEGLCANRTDLILPYGDGAFLGQLVSSCMKLEVGKSSNKIGIGDETFATAFRAETYISNSQMRAEQRRVADLLLSNKALEAARAMSDIEPFNYDEIEPLSVQLQRLDKEAIEKANISKKLAEM